MDGRFAVAFLVVVIGLAAVGVARCGGGNETDFRTDLQINIANGWGEQHYRLTCDPTGGDVPRPAALCALLALNATVMLGAPSDKATCMGGPGTPHIVIDGIYAGRKIGTREADACEGYLQAQKLWLSQLPRAPQP